MSTIAFHEPSDCFFQITTAFVFSFMSWPAGERKHNVLSAYAHALLIQTLRSTACNGLHSIAQRASRWMLTTLDRTDGDRFEITHEFFGMLLGVRRASVSTVVEDLVAQDILSVSRGKIVVHNRPQLEKTACECYGVIREAYLDFLRARAGTAR